MARPHSDLFSVQPIPHADRGVLSKLIVPSGSVLYRSKRPYAHVIFWEYRKEVCARCFHYDRGRKLPVRLNSVGKVFCSNGCQDSWLEEQGDIGLEAWRQLHQFIQSKNKNITNNHSIPSLTPRPDPHEIHATWNRSEESASTLGDKRTLSANTSPASGVYIGNHPWCQDVDPDILGYLLSGVICYHSNSLPWHSEVLDLAMDYTPYRSTADLNAHCHSYLQLTSLIPPEYLPSLKSSVCQILIGVASHNSFGIRSGSEDGEEYLGYGLYPGASYFNHSCNPNVSKKRLGSTWEFRASRDIEAGDECCITYLGGDEKDMTVTERRSRLKMFWDFECMCDRCKEDSEDT